MDVKQVTAHIKSQCFLPDEFAARGCVVTSAGVDRWKTLCPFHVEKTPSCIMGDQYFHCFGCGASGDVFELMERMDGLSFMESVSLLAERLGLEKPETTSSDYSSLLSCVKAAAEFYREQFEKLDANHVAVREIVSRGLNPHDGWYGFAPAGNALVKFLRSRGFSDETMVECGVARKSGRVYDFFRSRLMFLFTDRMGRPIGFSARKLYDSDKMAGKYVNSPESPVFHKSRVLYNVADARKKKGSRVYIVEGQFDVEAMKQLGPVVAASGTAFTASHARECAKLGDRLVFCFDGDEAGQKAARRVFESLPEIHDMAWVVHFPDNMDPCDFRKLHTVDELREFVDNNEISLIDYMISTIDEDVSTAAGRSRYVARGAEILSHVSDGVIFDNCVKLLALESLSSLSTVREAVGKVDEVSDNFSLADPDDDVALAFVRLGARLWPDALRRSVDVLPSDLARFVTEMGDGVLVAEDFSDEDLARRVLSTDFSPFYRFMSREELKDQFIFLHDELVSRNDDSDIQVRRMLTDAQPGDVAYLKSVLRKVET